MKASSSTWASRVPQTYTEPKRSSASELLLSTQNDVASVENQEPSVDQDSSIAVTETKKNDKSHLARLTTYWCSEGGDYYTTRGQSSTGVHLRQGHCAVDPSVIPYGSVVNIPGVGTFLAVDTGSAVVSRRAARLIGRNSDQRDALVIDLFFTSERAANEFAEEGPKFADITWWTPTCKEKEAVQARKKFADSDWTTLRNMGML